MVTLEDIVREVVKDMMDKDELFTALDVSNRVKLTQPHARHRKVRDVVRAMYTNEIEPQGWARSPITVTLTDGSQQEALLYHPLSASWDLDSKYDTQKRQQSAIDPTATAATTIGNLIAQKLATPSTPAPAPSHWGGALPPIASTKAPIPYDPLTGTGGHSATVTVSATTSVPMPTARDLWKQLFATQPSLFPTK